jgi:hypothetical protein
VISVVSLGCCDLVYCWCSASETLICCNPLTGAYLFRLFTLLRSRDCDILRSSQTLPPRTSKSQLAAASALLNKLPLTSTSCAPLEFKPWLSDKVADSQFTRCTPWPLDGGCGNWE